MIPSKGINTDLSLAEKAEILLAIQNVLKKSMLKINPKSEEISMVLDNSKIQKSKDKVN